MLCEQCHQQDATVHIQEIIGKKKTSLHLCSGCAAAKGLKDGPMSELDLAKLVLNLTSAAPEKKADAEADAATAPAADAGKPDVVCPACGLTGTDFRQHGRFGCSECYAVFGGVLRGLLCELHCGVRHKGKAPGHSAPPVRLAAPASGPDLVALETELARAVDAEAYERAAQLRDQIGVLRQQQNTQDCREKKQADSPV